MLISSLPLNHPEVPAFARETFKHEIKDLAENRAFDDTYFLNTQSGTQWDGFRHVRYIQNGMQENDLLIRDCRFPTWQQEIFIIIPKEEILSDLKQTSRCMTFSTSQVS